MRRQLVIMTRPAFGGSLTTPGHAMLAISTAGVGEEAWGFYGDGVRDETIVGGWGRYQRSVVIEINDRQYAAIKSEINRWRSLSYVLMYRDCTDFVISACRRAGIAVPDDSIWPNNLGEDFERIHGVGGGVCLAPIPT